MNQLARPEIALLEAAKSVEDLKVIHDKAEALEEYAKRANLGLGVQNAWAEYALRAARKAGGGLLPMTIQHGGDPKLRGATLESLGIEKTQSHRWQQMSSVPDADFEQWLAEIKAKPNGEVTSVDLRVLADRANEVWCKHRGAVAREGVAGG